MAKDIFPIIIVSLLEDENIPYYILTEIHLLILIIKRKEII